MSRWAICPARLRRLYRVNLLSVQCSGILDWLTTAWVNTKGGIQWDPGWANKTGNINKVGSGVGLEGLSTSDPWFKEGGEVSWAWAPSKRNPKIPVIASIKVCLLSAFRTALSEPLAMGNLLAGLLRNNVNKYFGINLWINIHFQNTSLHTTCIDCLPTAI